MATKETPKYLARPKTKPTETLKGKMNKWDNGYAEFIPTGTRESNRKMLKQLGNSSFYKSEGEKESSYSLHLNVDARSEDPVAEMFEQFQFLTESECKQKPQLPEARQGRMLLDNGEGLQIWLDRERSKVSIMTELACNQNIERMLLHAQSQMNVCIGRHRMEIVNLNNNK